MKSKKSFMRKTAIICGMILSLTAPLVFGGTPGNGIIRLNPGMKISRVSDGSVIVTSRNPQDKTIKHEFTDFYADLLMGAYRKQGIDNITETLRKKYYLSEDECRREIKHAINILTEWKIILREDEMALSGKE